ncbi:MAG: hypothetical protein MJ198_01215 [Bacteroidales bacterium]|nr:hypothetical protein [Bacteroidales bacterium]
MQKIRITLICFSLFVMIASSMLSSCGKKSFIEDADTTRGIWGRALLYNELGEREADNSDVCVKVRCIDTLEENPLKLLDTTYNVTTDKNGWWELYRPLGGWYFLEFSKTGYCKNTVYSHHYDTSRADTVENVYLAKPVQGSVVIDSVVLKDDVLSIYRTLYFTANYSSYSLSTWYFFGKSESVSPEDYVYAYVSGISSGSKNKEHKTVVYKSIDKLIESGFNEGETVYVRAYCDNARAVSYQIENDKWIFPNLKEGSKVFSFEIPTSEEE